MGPKISAEKSNKNKSPGQILKNRFMKNLRGSLVKAALVIKKPDIAKIHSQQRIQLRFFLRMKRLKVRLQT
jgi:plasmid maintenance system antidote protein VapI